MNGNQQAVSAEGGADRGPAPLTGEQEHALLRFLGAGTGCRVVMAAPRAHYVSVPGERALVLDSSHALPGARTVRYVRHGQTIFVADTDEPAAG